MIDFIRSMGFTPIPAFAAANGKEAFACAVKFMENRDKIPFDMDGAVIKAELTQEEREKIGRTSTAPKWLIAYKVSGETAQARITGLKTQVGKSGTIGLVYTVEPTDLAGTTISRLTAHNMSEVRRLGVMIGDMVTIRRMGDVIPGVVCVTDPSARTGDEARIETPTRCPACDSLLEEFGTKMQLRCTGEDCTGTLVRRLIHWAGRSAADMDAVGPSWIEQWVEAGLLASPSDFYKLSRLDIMPFSNMGDGRATKFLDSIEQAKQLGMRRCLVGMSIPQAGSGTAERLTKRFDTVEAVANASLVELMSVDDLGIVVASSIHEFFQRESTKRLISELREMGVNLDRLPEDAPLELSSMEGELVGKAICITGKTTVPRSELAEELKAAGAKVVSGVSSKTDILVCGTGVGAGKTNAAKKHGTKVVTEEEIRKLL